MVSLPEALFFLSAGVFTLFSPCGYAVMPGYVAYLFGRSTSTAKAVTGGVAAMLGMLIFFSSIGAAAPLLGRLIAPVIPLLIFPAAVFIIVMGLFILLNITVPIGFSRMPVPLRQHKGLGGFFMFGLLYGFSASGCTAPIFLSLVAYAISLADLVESVIMFGFYTLGVGLPLIATSALVASAKDAMIASLKKITPYIHKVSGLFLVAVGTYLLYYGYIYALPLILI